MRARERGDRETERDRRYGPEDLDMRGREKIKEGEGEGGSQLHTCPQTTQNRKRVKYAEGREGV